MAQPDDEPRLAGAGRPRRGIRGGTCGSCSRTTPSASPGSRSGSRTSCSTTASTGSRPRPCASCSTSPATRRRELAGDDVRGRADQHTEGRAVLHTALRNRSGTADPGRWRGRDAGGRRRCWTGCERFVGAVRSGAWRGYHRPADHRHRQYRHRRLGPRAADGLQGARALRRAGPAGAFRLQRRRRASGATPCAGSTRSARCSSSPPRPSPPRRR